MTEEPTNKGTNWAWPLRITEEQRAEREAKTKADLTERRRKMFSKEPRDGN